MVYIEYRLVTDNFPQNGGIPWQLSQLLLVYLNRILSILVIFAFAVSYLNKDSALLKYCNKAVFSWYILHQTAIVVLGAWFNPFNLRGATEFFLVLAGTIIGCFAIHHFVVRRLSFLHRVFGYQKDKPHVQNPLSGPIMRLAHREKAHR